jgi:hypothetical protein
VSASQAPSPPRLARALLRSALPDDVRNEVEGDLHELFLTRRAASGPVAAAAWYWLETLSFFMRFTFDRLAHVLRGLLGGDAAPSALDIKLGARILAKSPGLSLVGGLGIAVAVALGAAGYAVVNSYFFPVVPLNEGARAIRRSICRPTRACGCSRFPSLPEFEALTSPTFVSLAGVRAFIGCQPRLTFWRIRRHGT